MSLVKPKPDQKDESIISKVTRSLGRYIVAPTALFGISGFIFDIDGETKTTLQNSITDNFIEDNSVLNDHVAAMPESITLTKYVGELVDVPEDNSAKAKIGNLVTKLAPLAAALPAITSATSIIQGGLTGGAGALNNADNLYALFQNLNPFATKQQRAYIYFKAMAEQRIPLSIQTPFGYYRNMMIETLIATQKEDSEDISEFSLTLKQLRFATIATVGFDKTKFQNRAGNQNSPVTNNGKAAGKSTPRSVAASLLL